MVHLQLTCLGDAAVTLANEPLTGFQTDKMRALLIYLALEGQPHQRTALAHLLWPGYSDDSARHSLRQSLHRLRVILRDDEPMATGRPPWLLVTRQTVQFNPAASLRLDVARFRTLLAETATHPHAQLYTCSPCLARLRQAVELYQGDFLAGFTIADSDPFEEWRRITQEQLHLQTLDALTHLANAAEAAGDEEQTIRDAQRQLTLEPWHEAAHRRLMRILARRGQRAAALAQYNRCRQVLAAELGATPEAETLTLYEQIQRGDLDKERRRQEEKVTSEQVTTPPAPSFTPVAQAATVAPGPSHNLPLALPTLVGRGQVIDNIKAALGQARLVTLIGMGGVGKTTLAVQVAHALLDVYRDGVWWLELAALTDGELVTDTVATALGLSASVPARLLESLVSYLQPKTSLLLLDNCEHLLPATRQLCTTLLANCPHLRILATSRAPLHLHGEQIQPVTPLTIPAALPPFAELLTYSAIQLFVERARTAAPTFALTAENAPSVLEICQRLDGLPLALELAAARIRLLSPQDLAARLDRRFSLLRAAPSEPAVHRGTRHKTLRATIDWGYDLLSPAEQTLFRRLAVFAGGFTVAAAEAMAGEETLDLLDALVDQSFVMVERTADADRLYLLESLREYALEKLVTVGEERAARHDHLAYFLALAETAATHFAQPTQHEWYNRLEREHDNLRAALTWALATADDAGEAALRLSGALGRFWQVRGHLGEAKQTLLQALAAPYSPATGQPATNWRAKALRWAGSIVHNLGDNRQALALLQESLALYQMVNDQINIAHVLTVIGTIWDAQSNYTEALRYYEESQQLYRQLGDEAGIAVALNNCASVAHSQGDNVTARRLSEESITHIRATGNQGQLANLLTTLAEITQSLGDFATTRQALAEALTIHTANGDKLRSAVALCSWADVDRAQGDYGGARRHYLQGMALAHAIWDRRWLAISLEGVAYCSAALADPMTAVRLWSVAAALRTAITAPLPPAQTPPYEAALAAAQTRLGAEPFAAAWEAGEHMALDEARRTAEEWTPPGEDRETGDRETGDRETGDKGDKVITASSLTPSPPHPFTPSLPHLVTAPPLHDWGEMPAVDRLVGRATEMAQLTAWLTQGNADDAQPARLVTIMGLGGMGKTTLAAALTKAVAPTFTVVIWRSLLNAPLPTELLRDWLQRLARQTLTTLPETLDEQIRLLLDYLRRERCLLVLDNLESIFTTAEAQSAAGVTRPGYEGYDQLLQRLGGSEHQSCLLLTSREQPYSLLRLGRQTQRREPQEHGRICVLPLTGLDHHASHELLQRTGLHASAQDTTALIQSYSGNPLALQIVATTIADFFGGDVAAFQQEADGLFDGIRLVLDQQFARLSALERDLLLWLAIEREAVTVPILRSNLVQLVSTRELLEALQALQNRSLLEKRDNGLTLQNVIIEYSTEYLVAQVCREIIEFSSWILDSEVDEFSSKIQNPKSKIQNSFLNRFALLKAQAKVYVRQSQERLILAPLGQRLLQQLDQAGVHAVWQHQLALWREQRPPTPGYFAGNWLNLLLHLGFDLTGYDFSRLVIRQAYLARARLVNVNFTEAAFADTSFADEFGHILAVAISPDGELFAAAGTDTVIRLWRRRDGQRVGELHGHTHAIRALAFQPTEGTAHGALLLASAGMDQTVRLWDVAQEHCRATLQGHEGTVYDLAFSPDGRTLVSSGLDQTLRLWELGEAVERSRLVHTWRGSTESINKVRFSPNGSVIASAGSDQMIRLWTVARTEGGSYQEHLLATLVGHTGSVVALAFSPDGQTVASGSADQTVRVWTMTNPGATAEWRLRHTLQGHTHWVRALAFSPDGQTLASGSADRTLRLWTVADGQPLALWHGHQHVVWAVAFTPDGTTLLSGGEDDTIQLWDLRRAGQPQLSRSLQGHTTPMPHLAFSPDGVTLASSAGHERLYLWDWGRGHCLRILAGYAEDVHQLGFTGGGKTLVSTSSNHLLRFWDVASGQLRQVQSTFPLSPRALAVAPTGTLLAVGGNGNAIQLWPLDAQSGLVTTGAGHTPQASLRGHTDEISALAFLGGTADAPLLLASSSDDQSVRLWDVSASLNTGVDSGQCLHQFEETCHLMALAVSPDGALLASGGTEGVIWLWQLAPTASAPDGAFPRRLAVLRGHRAVIRRLAFRSAAPGQPLLLASASEDQSVRLWDVSASLNTGVDSSACRQILQGHRQYVLSVAFSPDGTTLASSSVDQTIRLWDVASGVCQRVLQPPGPYAGMQIRGVTGISEAQKAALRALGAVAE